MAAFSRMLGHGDDLQSKSAEIQADLPGFYEEHYVDFDGRKTNPSDIRRRDELFYAFLVRYIS
jgi:hypothetical protein